MTETVVPPEFELSYPNVESGVELGPRLQSTRIYNTDAVVVGTGAGGAPAAARLRDAGYDVLLLEEGGLHLTSSFNTDPLDSAIRLYRDAGTSAILGTPPIVFAEGRCVGGSTVINGGMSWRTPDRVLEHWSRDLNLAGTDPVSMAAYFDEAEGILNVELQDPETVGVHSQLFADGARRLGWELKDNRRNMRRCVGLNNCGLGCPTGAKQSMLVTEIPRALNAGAQLVCNARVNQVLTKRGRAVGVKGHFVDQLGKKLGRFEVRSRLVVLAAGARFTPAIMLRSRVGGTMVGRGLHTHPNAKVVGVFDERLDPWIGAHQTHQVHEFLDDGILMACSAVPPGILATALPGIGEGHGRRMSRYNHMMTAACLIEDSGEGRVRLGPDRRPWMTFNLSAQDTETIHRGVRLLSELLFMAGARSVLLPFADLPKLESVDELDRIDARPRSVKEIELLTVHIMSSCRMAIHPSLGPCDAWGRVHDVGGLAIADASLIPSSVGVNPMETIVALSLRNTDRWIEDLGRE
ncbi:MAG: GMC family oxidoreductase N-terminal domain-containing protein [Candidatus Binatia bacterium]